MNTYAIREVWGSQGAPTLGYVTAASATRAVVAFLRSRGYDAREESNGDLITSDDAPSLVAYKLR